jgi:hypothetical protein
MGPVARAFLREPRGMRLKPPHRQSYESRGEFADIAADRCVVLPRSVSTRCVRSGSPPSRRPVRAAAHLGCQHGVDARGIRSGATRPRQQSDGSPQRRDERRYHRMRIGAAAEPARRCDR